jgi:hypothetical protein
MLTTTQECIAIKYFFKNLTKKNKDMMLSHRTPKEDYAVLVELCVSRLYTKFMVASVFVDLCLSIIWSLSWNQLQYVHYALIVFVCLKAHSHMQLENEKVDMLPTCSQFKISLLVSDKAQVVWDKCRVLVYRQVWTWSVVEESVHICEGWLTKFQCHR